MKYRVIIQPSADVDMDKAYLWMVEHAPDHATKWFNGLEDAIQTLESFPLRCPLAEESGAFAVEIRQLIYGQRVGAYRILFTVAEDAVQVLHVRHGRRKRLQPRGRR